jgi:GNAT superfamily N-acetyltransferase
MKIVKVDSIVLNSFLKNNQEIEASIESWYRDIDSLEELHGLHFFLIDKNEFLAHAMLSSEPDNYAPEDLIIDDVLWLEEVFVREDKRRKGYAKLLLNKVLSSTNKDITLFVRKESLGAQKLYSSLGFKDLDSNQDYLLMIKPRKLCLIS